MCLFTKPTRWKKYQISLIKFIPNASCNIPRESDEIDFGSFGGGSTDDHVRCFKKCVYYDLYLVRALRVFKDVGYPFNFHLFSTLAIANYYFY